MGRALLTVFLVGALASAVLGERAASGPPSDPPFDRDLNESGPQWEQAVRLRKEIEHQLVLGGWSVLPASAHEQGWGGIYARQTRMRLKQGTEVTIIILPLTLGERGMQGFTSTAYSVGPPPRLRNPSPWDEFLFSRSGTTILVRKGCFALLTSNFGKLNEEQARQIGTEIFSAASAVPEARALSEIHYEPEEYQPLPAAALSPRLSVRHRTMANVVRIGRGLGMRDESWIVGLLLLGLIAVGAALLFAWRICRRRLVSTP